MSPLRKNNDLNKGVLIAATQPVPILTMLNFMAK